MIENRLKWRVYGRQNRNMKDQAHLINVKSDGPVQCTFDAARGSKHDSEDFNLQLDLETMTS